MLLLLLLLLLLTTFLAYSVVTKNSSKLTAAESVEVTRLH
jgi:hypothetical protein